MSESHLPESQDPVAWIDWTSTQQALASDPQRSAWVSANAGSGKTHVLTQRVIRLLLSGARPSSILCLTYTKAAASEMSNRVFARLAEWAVLPDKELSDRIAAIEGKPPSLMTLTEARRLFAKALETPGGLKIQTIHAFCEALLHQFPLEANVAGHFSVLDDRAAATMLADARRALLTATSAEKDSILADAFSEVLNLADEWGLDKLLNEIISSRRAVRDFTAAAATTGGTDAALRRALGIAAEDNEAALLARYWPLPGLTGAALTTYIEVARAKGGVQAQAIAEDLAAAAQATDTLERVRLIESAFLTASDKPKADKTFCTAAMLKMASELPEAIGAARDHVVACRDRLRVFQMYRASSAALVLAERLDQDYEDLKKVRSQLDFEDLIARTADLLTKSAVGPWIHYKLDQGIDHILVDEAQDTSPIQWTVIRSLRDDFFSGEGAKTRLRTFFAVGDEKQSIYSFQGARPERFSLEGADTKREVEQGGQKFSSVRLPLSFRSTAAVLSAVDQVFSVDENARGLSATRDAVVHMSSRTGHPGSVDLWDMVVPPVVEASEDWTAPFDSTPESAPSAVLARRIAHVISGMIGHDTIIEKGVERPIEAGDILILVRKRGAFVTALTRELKRRGDVPVAGADRLRLNGHIAVQDLLALGRFALMPSDDLSLASLLKSPLFDLTEADVFEASAGREPGKSVWHVIQALAEGGIETWRSVVEKLNDLVALSRRLSVHDFYAHVLAGHGGRRAFLARLGSEVSDILDEFLSYALATEASGLPALQAFVSGLELETPEVKREQDKSRNEVRIMTVHASKGLEAPIVFVVDGGSAAFSSSHLARFRLMETPGSPLPVPVWIPTGDVGNSLTQADAERNKALAEEEYRRLLYVAMTRAADRLVVCGYRGVRVNTGIWHEMVASTLGLDEARCEKRHFDGPDGGWEGLSWRLPAAHLRFPRREEQSRESLDERLPDALRLPLPPSPPLPRPLSPSGIGIALDEEAADAPLVSPLFGSKESAGIALQKGRLVHRMLQVLPAFAEGERAAAAERFSERAARFWPAGERAKLVASVMAILHHPALTAVFSAHGQAEVSVMGTITVRGTPRAVSGRIDRMVVTEDAVLLLDYKTNRHAPATAADAPFSHRAQLAIYSEILKPLYPGKRIGCLLVYTEAARAIELTEDDVAQTLAELNGM